MPVSVSVMGRRYPRRAGVLPGAAIGSVRRTHGDRARCRCRPATSTRPRWRSAGRSCPPPATTSCFATPSGQPGAGRRPHGDRAGPRPLGRHPAACATSRWSAASCAPTRRRGAAYAALLDDAAFGSPAPLGRGPPQRLRRARPARRAPRPWHARLPREPRGAADGRRLVPRRQAGRGDLPRRPRGGARRRARDGRSVLHGRRTTALDLGAGAQGVGARQPDRASGTRLLPHLRGGAGAAAGATCRCSRR